MNVEKIPVHLNSNISEYYIGIGIIKRQGFINLTVQPTIFEEMKDAQVVDPESVQIIEEIKREKRHLLPSLKIVPC